MITSKIKSRTIIVLFALAATGAASVYFFQSKSFAAGFNGAIYTTTFAVLGQLPDYGGADARAIK